MKETGMDREVLRQRAGLGEEEIEKLSRLEEALPLMADLVGRDLFIDCRDKADGRMFVAAQAGPLHFPSSYRSSVVGRFAEEENEPAVYRAAETLAPVRDLKAVTQESSAVRQDAVPVQGAGGELIAVLIGERDVSGELLKEQKYHALVRRVSEREPEIVSAELGARREAHHRIKNHLQLVVSLMNMQLRRAKTDEAKQVLRESISRIQSIASVNELLVHTDSEEVRLKSYLDGIRQNLSLLYAGESWAALKLEGDEFTVSGEAAADIALVVNELVSNAFRHAFSGGKGGTVMILLKKGERYSSITVRDDGCGFDVHSTPGGVGLSVVRMTVKDKLHGKLYVSSDENGSSFTFDFENNN